ncbi:hypothetical protein A3A79_02515 [Candidatus Gottesmanbacteria bacterium RIFCSPLOWO2_01_FULL_43_11b]|uniref:Cell division protein FtsL n=1 Tax=Candidatus Gottesmanbacteria bacterium RIFCSPLOWO2_01_FULL_43_11b TaxID=1798392 RepID=A0A1F6AH84_9BACT|nr:MAG: hypothetical protein A3A79_02515 [Candidatus Gottesmanbacteria bacterium RIFCSPLOWO2_01_FULL_43_11b]
MMGYKIVKFFKSRLFRLVGTLVSIFVIVGVIRSMYSLWQKRDIVNERREVLLDLEKKQEELKKKLNQAQSPEFIEKSAREDLGLIKEGEAIVLVPMLENSKQETEKPEELPNWKKWWKLFF